MKPLLRVLPFVMSILLAVIHGGCGKKNDNPVDPGTTNADGVYTQQQGAITLERFSTGRDTTPGVSDSAVASLVKGHTAFAMDLYHKLDTGAANLFFSPYSLSTALAMTWGGARGQTEQDMAAVLHFPAPQATLHAECDALDLALTAHAEACGFELHIVNQLWGEKTWTFLPDYLKLLSVNYGAGMLLLDFLHSPGPSAQVINSWVATQTQQRIQNLIPPGAISDLTKLVLTNAIYFKAQWADTFEHQESGDRIFYRGAADSISTTFMHRNGSYGYCSGSEFSAVKLPYKGNETSMLIILPAQGMMAQTAATLSTDCLDSVRSSLQSTYLALYLPKFSFTTGPIGMSAPLMSLGMASAFDDSADFSGIDGMRDLRITEVYHKAFVAVDEEGTEAAAATAVIMGNMASAPPQTTFSADRPFIFLICDDPTGAVLFMGELADPSRQ